MFNRTRNLTYKRARLIIAEVTMREPLINIM